MDPNAPVPGGEELWIHGRFLRSVARGLVTDGERADDLVQETWAVALEHPPRHGAAPRAWLAQILRRLAIRRGTRESERGPREHAAALARPAPEARSPDALAAELELARRVLASVEGLREPYRETVYLRYYRALAPQEIAARQGVPLKTVKTRLARGLQLLREDLDRQHGGRREAWVALLLPLARAPLGPPLRLPRSAPTPAAPLAASVPGLLSPVVLAGALLLSAAGVAGVLWLRGSSAPRQSSQRPAPVGSPDSGAAALVPTPSDPRARQPLAPVAEAAATAPALVRLYGRVCRSEGEPLAGAEVHAALLGPAGGGVPAGRGRLLEAESEPESVEESRAVTDADGEFELALSASGLARLTVEFDGCAPSARKLLVFLGQDLDLGTVSLDPGVFLSGRVFGPDGGPLAGVELFEQREDDGLLVEPFVRRERVARTDEQGRFALARQAVGAWALELESALHAPARASGQTRAPGERIEDLEIVLVAGATVRGRVFGLEPRQRASVLLRPVDAGGSALSSGRARRAELDEQGGFELGAFEPGETLELLVLAEGPSRALLVGPRRVRAGDEALELWVEAGEDPSRHPPFGRAGLPSERGLAERGRGASEPESAGEALGSVNLLVLAPDGRPAAGVLVARASDEGAARRRRALPEIRVADRRGRLTWSDLPAGPQRFRVIAGVFADEWASPSGWEEARVQAGAAVELELTSAPRGELSGTVRVGGHPLAEAEILLRPARPAEASRGPGGGPALRVRSDLRGRYAFHELPLGSYRLQLFHPERARPVEREIRLGAGPDETDLELEDARLRGIVRDAAGQPVAGASVRVLADPDPAPTRPWQEPNAMRRGGGTATGPDGAFELAGLEGGQGLRLEISAEGQATLWTAELRPDSFEELRLVPEARLGLTLEASGEPFFLLRATGPGGSQRSLGVPVGRPSTLRGLAPGLWRLELLARERGGEARSLAEQSVVLAVGDNELEWSVP